MPYRHVSANTARLREAGTHLAAAPADRVLPRGWWIIPATAIGVTGWSVTVLALWELLS
jgi:hypothetical protein